MPKQPFTPAGVELKIDELYALSDPLLEEQAEAAKSDFPTWLSDNFSFTDPQSDYLGDIATEFTTALGYQFSVALGNRLPITLMEPFIIDPDDYSSKILKTEENPTLIYNSVTGLAATGQLVVSIMLSDPD